MGVFLPFYCRGGNAKGDKTNGGRVHNMQAKPRRGNAELSERSVNRHRKRLICECRIKNARIVFTLAMATILRRRIA